MMERYVFSTSTLKHTQKLTPLSIWLVPFNHSSKLSRISSLKSVLKDSGDTFPIPSQSKGRKLRGSELLWGSGSISRGSLEVIRPLPELHRFLAKFLAQCIFKPCMSLSCFLPSSSSLKVVVIWISWKSRVLVSALLVKYRFAKVNKTKIHVHNTKAL